MFCFDPYVMHLEARDTNIRGLVYIETPVENTFYASPPHVALSIGNYF
jgi:hypothetical protein